MTRITDRYTGAIVDDVLWVDDADGLHDRCPECGSNLDSECTDERGVAMGPWIHSVRELGPIASNGDGGKGPS